MLNRNQHEGAVCIQCGSFKPLALEQCPGCAFFPATPEDCARSLMLSATFDVGVETFGLSRAALQEAADDIARGGEFIFDPDVFAQVLATYMAASSVTSRQLILDGLRWLLPPLLLIAVVLWLITTYPSN